MIHLALKILEWSFVAAAVQVYIALGPGGEAVGALVESFQNVLISIDWAQIGEHLWQAVKGAGGGLAEGLQGGDDPAGAGQLPPSIEETPAPTR